MLLVLKKKCLNETVLFVLTDASENNHILKLKQFAQLFIS